MNILHHGARDGVTGSCHELQLGKYSLLIDCGAFQGEEAKASNDITFPVEPVRALILTHCHIDHVGRIPWLLAAGFRGPIYATEATAALLPLMLEDGLKLQLGLSDEKCEAFIRLVRSQLKPVPFDCRAQIMLPDGQDISLSFRQAGHILGSAYVELLLPDRRKVVFSGDLGPSNTPLLVDPEPPLHADVLVLESTYGDKLHPGTETREQALKSVVEQSLKDGGAILIPAFSLGRTQELLFDLENIVNNEIQQPSAESPWLNLPIVLDSPLAMKITQAYQGFKRLWTKEAKARLDNGRHPLDFDQCTQIDEHSDHIGLVNRLKASGEPAVIVAASGMCSGGRIMNYLEALLPDPRTDLLLIGYQARGTLGRELQNGAREVIINNTRIEVKARVHTMTGYSAHADQRDLIRFVQGIEKGPAEIRLVHGDRPAQEALARRLQKVKPDAKVIVCANLNQD
ncbi:MBL fold metallo-hydrolase RNA specificity domain-containing protein [Photobacterium halotolerans]|uniref:MBL fold metallo-hydrolase n=1 Tax=Photobacterium halotolerans TaxID=265726 RepID=A0A7X4W941_9GAMM|nr:MBL fold metallo-hydrolase [Photobacterium halotolerans]NAW64072.1 MBL fold metallo-hydrolase [Photobacterium halotolerans]NAX48068.1 MBL fold metallo-hydrolase [Photobacterium halotolerans]